MDVPANACREALGSRKFGHPDFTASGTPRAEVALRDLRTLWFNTGTLCNLTCKTCYIESSPRNDRLVYLTAAEVSSYLDESERGGFGLREVGFTGGEPFMNPDLVSMLEDSLGRGHRALVLTNAMRPMMKRAASLGDLGATFGDRLTVRVSLDHYGQILHEKERGSRTWNVALEGLKWLGDNGIRTHVAGRAGWREPIESLRNGYARLFSERGIEVDAFDPDALVLFPEMDEAVDVPEVTEACWDTLGVSPDSMMCATSRMIVKRKGAEHPVVVPCTLLPYGRRHELGRTLGAARGPVKLAHPNCSQFCVLGGGSCSGG